MDRAHLFRLILVGVACIGFVVASIALYYHFDDSGEAFCDVSDQFNCSVVYSSQYSYIAGIPVPVFGMFGYAFIIFAIINQQRIAKLLSFSQKEYWQYGFFTVGFMFVFQTILTFVSMFLIQSYCLLCLVSQGTITALVIGVFMYWRSLIKNQK